MKETIKQLWERLLCAFKITDMNKAKKNAILWLLSAVVYFLIFAWDIENDRDFWTWLWLLNSIVCFLGSMRNWIAADRK